MPRTQQVAPRTAVEYNVHGLSRHNSGYYDAAIGDFDKSLTLVPGFGATCLVRGNALNAKGNYEGAIAAYSEAIESNSRAARPYQRFVRPNVPYPFSLRGARSFISEPSQVNFESVLFQ